MVQERKTDTRNGEAHPSAEKSTAAKPYSQAVYDVSLFFDRDCKGVSLMTDFLHRPGSQGA